MTFYKVYYSYDQEYGCWTDIVIGYFSTKEKAENKLKDFKQKLKIGKDDDEYDYSSIKCLYGIEVNMEECNLQ